MAALRVTYFLDALADEAGLRHQEVGFARALAARGHALAMLSYFRPTVAEETGLAVRTIVPTRAHGALHEGPLAWCLAGRALRALRAPQPDVVVVTGPHEARLALRLRDRTGCAVAYRVDALDGIARPPAAGREGSSRNGRTASDDLSLLRRVDRVLAPSAFVRGLLAEAKIDARLLPMGVDVRRFHPGCRVPGVAITSPQLLYLGAYDEDGGALRVVQAVQRVLASCPDAVLVMHGTARSAQAVERVTAYVREHGLAGRVLPFGPIDRAELPYRLTQASVLVDGSTASPFGVHLLEAQACGIPCVGFRAGGVPEVVGHADSGLLAPAGDVEALAQALIRLVRDDALRVALARGALERAQRFAFERLAPLLERTLGELVERRTAHRAGA